MKQSGTLRPLPLWKSLVLFGIPALVAIACQYIIWPYFASIGFSQEVGYHLAHMIMFVGLLLASLAAYVLEGNSLNWRSFRQRYRLKAMGWREWRWTLASVFAVSLLGILSTRLAFVVYDFLEFRPPEVAPPGVITNIPLYVMGLLSNILGEELWWRGYVLPRQELRHGRCTWILHGTLWAFFHLFKWWAVPFMLLTTWIVPFMAQRLKNTTPGIISHLITNGLSILAEIVLM